MKNYDVFNGDADGICALQQLRLNDPVESYLITGVKRDIQLVDRVYGQADDNVTVLDISLDKNRKGLEELLSKSVNVLYFDHHFAGEIPLHPRLKAHIDTSPDTCTSLLVDQYLEGKQRSWAVVGAFGDNFDDRARDIAQSLNLSEDQLLAMRELGVLINYNGYGLSVDELHFHPEKLYKEIHPYENPLDFIADADSFQTLRDGYQNDMGNADAIKPELLNDKHGIYILPDEKWASRVSGVYSNKLATGSPQRAHAMLTALKNDAFRVSVRAPFATKEGADELCRRFKTGGGRKAAAGINELAASDYDSFVEQFKEVFC